jgi:hypothetical protein
VNKKFLAAAVGLGAISASLLSTAAVADPVGPPTYRALAGGGSDTTEEVMQAMSEAITDTNGTKIIANYNAQGGAFDSKDPAALPATATTCNYAAQTGSNGAGIRPNGSSAGRDRLVEASTVGNARNGCLDWARSSSGPGSSPLAVKLTYIPYAVDSWGYALRSDSTLSRTYSVAQLKSIYQCAVPSVQPLLAQTGSGTRPAWLQALGLTESTLGSCVRDTWDDPNDGSPNLVPIQEHDARVLLNKNEIVGFSVGQWSSMAAGVITDKRGRGVLANIGGVPVQAANPGAVSTRKMYNLIPTSKVGDPGAALLNEVFVGANSKVCQQTAIIGKYGFGNIADCGSTVTTSP